MLHCTVNACRFHRVGLSIYVYCYVFMHALFIFKTLRFIFKKKTPKQLPISLSSVTGNVNNRNNAFFYHLVRSRAIAKLC
jgi:hypothetical protein